MKALIVKPGPMKKILDGSKSWEIRRGRCNIRGLIGLIESGSGAVVGVAHLADCIGPLKREQRIQNAQRMGITVDEAAARWPQDSYAWVLRKRRRLSHPVRYVHPQGAIRWVPLSPAMEKAVLKQLH